jgi:hypothetical protein
LRAFVGFVGLSVSVAACRNDIEVPGTLPSFRRMLFLGNSITVHTPNPSIGWNGNWGMAASSPSGDYAHVLAARIRGAALEERNISALETDPVHFDARWIDSSLALGPDLVVVELGDNATDLGAFRAAYTALIGHLVAARGATIVCVSTWWRSPSIDQAIRDVCLPSGLAYADIGGLYANPINRAATERSFSDAGVGIHPGDQGMNRIADVLGVVLTRSAPAFP